jgi:hypothetical protein
MLGITNKDDPNSGSTSLIPKSKNCSLECKVCGTPAVYSHFGVVSCDPCKVFFRRNAKRELVCLDLFFIYRFSYLFI